MIDLKDKTVFVTGGSSMIGRQVCQILKNREALVVAPSHQACNLLDHQVLTQAFWGSEPDYVIHLATYSGNIQFNQKYPAETFFKTTIMGLNVLNQCHVSEVKKVVSVLSSCAVADLGLHYLREEDLHKGPPNKSIESHGYAKRNLDIMSRMLNQQFQTNAVCCIVNNSFGPYDHFNDEKGKVVSSLIRRFVDAKKNSTPEIVCWGSGKPLREFIYCKDAAEGIVQCLEKYDDCSIPLNISSHDEISIYDLVYLISDIVGYSGTIKWDGRPDGQLRKSLDQTRMNQYINIKYTPLEKALTETIQFYMENQ